MLELAALWNAGDIDGFLAAQAPDAEFTPDPSFPDGGTFSGDQLKDFLDQWAATFEGSQVEVLDIVDHGSAVTATCRWHMRGSRSQVEIPLVDFTFVVWFEAAVAARAAGFFDHDLALAAVGAGGP